MTSRETILQKSDIVNSGKQARLFGALFFVSGIILVGVAASVDYLESTRMMEFASIALRLAVVLAGLAFVSYRGKIILSMREHVSLAEKLVALVFALAAGAGVVRWFANEAWDLSEPGAARFLLGDVTIPQTAMIALLIGFGLLAAFAFYILFALGVRILRGAFQEREAFQYTGKHIRKKPAFVWATAVALALLSAVVCAFTIDKGQNWGPDFALYIKQGISIAKGNFSDIDAAWGYSAMLSPVYLLAGYDTTTFSSLIYYKIPAIVCMALAVIALLFYFERRFPLKWAALLTLMFAINPSVIGLTNSIISNIPHLLFSMLSILSMYRLFEGKTRKEQVIYGILSGVLIWCSDTIRANGIVLLLTLLCVHAVALLTRVFRKNRFLSELGEQARVKYFSAHVLPYAVFLALWFASSLILPDKGTESSLLGEATFLSVRLNVGYYITTLTTFIWSLTRASLPYFLLAWLWIPLMVIGLWHSIKRDLISCVYFGGTMLLLLLLVFRQGFRYPLPVIPMLVLFIAVGIQAVALSSKKLFGPVRFGKILIGLAAAFLVLNFCWAAGTGVKANLDNHREYDAMSYSEDAKDTYRYIQANTEANAVIVFNKPRVVEINTNRVCVYDISLVDAGLPCYLLITQDEYAEHQGVDDYDSLSDYAEDYGVNLTLIYENPRFQLYNVSDAG